MANIPPIQFGTVLQKKGIKARLLQQSPAKATVQNLQDGSVYDVPTHQFKAEYQRDHQDIFTSRSGQWRDFKLVPRGTTYQDIDGKQRRCQEGVLIRESTNANAFYEPSLYYAIGAFEAEKGNSESEQMYQEMLNLAHIHGPLKPHAVRGMANSIFTNRPYVFALAGYSDADSSYERGTMEVMKALVNKLGAGKMGIVTSPTAMENSIDATGTLISQKYNIPIVYVTAEGYIQYIDTNEFPSAINKELYTFTPKLFGKTNEEYSRATAEASNICLVTGGRNTAVADAVNALRKGNKVVIIRDAGLTTPSWDGAKNRVDNASKYLADQVEAYLQGRPLPHESRGDFTPERLHEIEQKFGPLSERVKIVDVDSSKQRARSMEKQLGDSFMYFLTC